MDLESGDTIYVEATVHNTVDLRTDERGITMLTIEEARTLAGALLMAANEAEKYHAPRP
jgi:hypothetical protein